MQLTVVKLAEPKHGFVLLPRRWVVERSFAWKTRFRRLARDDERLTTSLEGLHYVAFACLELQRAAPLLSKAHMFGSIVDSAASLVHWSHTP
jgi:Transposase DDE domain